MEKGFFWVKVKGFEDSSPTIGRRYNDDTWQVLEFDSNFTDEDLVIGPRVKGQEECQSGDSQSKKEHEALQMSQDEGQGVEVLQNV